MKQINISMSSDNKDDHIFFSINCEDLIDRYEYHDAPDTIYMYPSIEELELLRDKIEGLLNIHAKNVLVRQEMNDILAQGAEFVVNWLKERGWKLHFVYHNTHSAKKIVKIDNSVDYCNNINFVVCTKSSHKKVSVEYAVFAELWEQGGE